MQEQREKTEPGSPRTSRPRLHRLVWAAAWISFFADFSTELIYGVLPAFYLQTLALGIVSLGVIEGTAEAVVAVAKLWSGTRSDRTGRRGAWMFAGYTLSGAAKPLIGLVSGGLAAGSLRAIDRLGKGIRGAPRDALIADTIDRNQKGRAFGVIRSMDHAGALVGGLAAAVLLAGGVMEPRSLFFLSAIPGAVAAGIIVLFVRDPRRVGRTDRGAATHAPPGLKRFLLPVSVFALGNSSDMLLLAVAYERFVVSGVEHPLARLPLLWALLHVIRSAGSAWGGRLSDRVSRVKVLAAGWLVYAGVYLIAAWLASDGPAWLAWVVFAFYGVHTIFTEAPEKALVADLTPGDAGRGGAFGLVQFVSGVGVLPATVLAAWVWSGFGPGAAMLMEAAIAVAAAGVLARVMRGAG